MNICFICNEYPPALHGGIGAVTQTTARALRDRGHNVRVVGVHFKGEEVAPYEEDQGIRVWRLSMARSKFGWLVARHRMYRVVRDWVKRGEIDLIEAPDWQGYTSLWPRVGVPIVNRLHGSLTYFAAEMNKPVRPVARWLEVRSFHRADECSSCSHYTAARTSELFGARQKPVTVLYNSVTLSQSTSEMPREKNHVIFAGTLTAKKGIIQLIKTWPEVYARNPEARLNIYGKDTGLGNGETMIPHLNTLLPERVRDSVRFCGHVSVAQLRTLYQHCTLAVFPSYSEAFAIAPLEAMAEGCPVIVANRSSGPELIEHGVNGLLIDPDNCPQIAESILGLLKNETTATRLGAAGRKTIEERFSSERIVGQVVDFYSDCIRRFHQNGSVSPVQQQA